MTALPIGLFSNIGPPEVLIILGIAVLIFGASKIPELARALGKSVNEFKKGKAEGAGDDEAEAGEKKDQDSADPAE